MNVPEEVVRWKEEYLMWCKDVHKLMSDAKELADPHEKKVFHILSKYFKNRVPRSVLLYPASVDAETVCITKSGLVFEGYSRGNVLTEYDVWKVVAGLMEEQDVVLRNLQDAEHKFLLRDMKLFLECFPKNVRFATGTVYLDKGFFGSPQLRVSKHEMPFSFVKMGRDEYREIPFDSEEAKGFDAEAHRYSGNTTVFNQAREELGDGAYCRIGQGGRNVAHGEEDAQYVRRVPGGVNLGLRKDVDEEKMALHNLSLLGLAVDFSRSSEQVMAELHERFAEYKAAMETLGETLEAKFGRRMLADQL